MNQKQLLTDFTAINESIVTISGVLKIVPLSKSTIYHLIKTANFPAPKKLPGAKKSMWFRDEVIAWLDRNLK